MPERKSFTQSMAKAGKKVLATDTAQGVIGAVADKMEEIAVDKADDAAETVKERAASAGGRKPPRPTKSAKKKSSAKRTGAKRSSAKRTGAKRTGAKRTGAKRSAARTRT
jgi:hypothetical protein